MAGQIQDATLHSGPGCFQQCGRGRWRRRSFPLLTRRRVRSAPRRHTCARPQTAHCLSIWQGILGANRCQKRCQDPFPRHHQPHPARKRVLTPFLTPVAYDLRESHDLLLHQHHNGDLIAPQLNLDGKTLFFSRVPLTWEQWVECWQRDADGKGHPRLLPESLSPSCPRSRHTACRP
jgi:hypothetical protein